MLSCHIAIPEELVASVVAEVSQKMAEPDFAQLAVGNFVQAHPDVSRWVSARMEALGGGEAVIHTVFHAELLAECVRQARGSEPSSIGFAELDQAAVAEPLDVLKDREPALADYLVSNVDHEGMRSCLAHIALAFDPPDRG